MHLDVYDDPWVDIRMTDGTKGKAGLRTLIRDAALIGKNIMARMIHWLPPWFSDGFLNWDS